MSTPPLSERAHNSEPSLPSSETMTLPPAKAPSESATLPPTDSATQGQSLDGVTVPGYEILRELGRGGMGVVYQARQVQADRLVALKMILHAEHTDADGRTRFQSEARAVARLQHPHIVQIYEVGEHNGLPFFSLEFCAGGGLDRKLAGTPLEARPAATLVEKLARAMQAAHQAHVIHRDLKPANVLLTAEGEPKITDFGLAKRLDEQGRTQTGVIMGTPSYMAPEQAGGGKDVGPAADVYALGAILYECLTGRPPFKAATPLDTILQVVSDEPVPPSQLQSKVPRDLETICLKCLHKEPGKRYASTAALADDLGRFQRGEPIAARPVGRLERGWRWCRRNPALGAALAAVAASLIGGSLVATVFAVQANEAKKQAEQRAEAEATANDLATRQKKAADEARNDLEKSNDQLLTSMARSVLRSFTVHDVGGQPSALEREALWELASSPEGNLGVRFIEEALRGPAQTQQLKNRAAYALQAAVALDGTRRTRVEQLLGEHLRAAGITPEQRLDVALVLTHFEIQDSALIREVVRVLTEAMSKEENSGILLRLAQRLLVVAARLEPKEAAAVCGRAAAILNQTMSNGINSYFLMPLAQGLSEVAARLEPKEAAAVCGQAAAILSRAMSKQPTDPSVLLQLAQGLSAVAAHMEPKEAAIVCSQAAAILNQAMTKTMDSNTLRQLAQVLSAVAARLNSKEAGEVAATLRRAMSETRDPQTLNHLAQGLSKVGARLEPKEAVTIFNQAIRNMSEQPEGPSALAPLAQGLSAVAARLEPKEAAAVCGQAAAIFSQTMNKQPTNSYSLLQLARGLSVVAARMEPKEAAAILNQAMRQPVLPDALEALAQGLSGVAARLEPKEAAAVCGQAAAILSQTMSKQPANPSELRSLAEGLAAVAAHMEPKEAAIVCRQAAAILNQTMTNWMTNSHTLWYLARAVSAVARRMDPKEAAAVCCQAAATLRQAMSKTTDPQTLWKLSQGLSEVGARLLEPKEAAAILSCDVREGALWPYKLQQSVQGVSAVLRREDSWPTGSPCYGLVVAIGTLGEPRALLLAPGLLQLAVAPPPPPLPAQMLVNLLKQPFCVGEARKLVLEQLSRHYQRPFADQWDFVRFAQEQKLDIDLTTPPRRPETLTAGGKP